MAEEVTQEQLLLEQIAEGDHQAFKIIFNRYKDRFYGVALKMMRSPEAAEEVVQEVFCTLWLRRTVLIQVENPTGYLFSIARHLIAKHFREKAKEERLREKIELLSTRNKNFTEETVQANESRQLLQELVHQLPAQQQQVYKLSREEGLSRKEIADHLSISPHTVKNHLLKAVKFIRGNWN